MRSREEILADAENYSFLHGRLMLEILLDIRDTMCPQVAPSNSKPSKSLKKK